SPNPPLPVGILKGSIAPARRYTPPSAPEMTTPTVVGGTTLCVRAWLGVVAHLLQDAHTVGHAPVLDHLAVREPGNVDHVDADRLPGRRVAELPGAAVGPAGPTRSHTLSPTEAAASTV